MWGSGFRSLGLAATAFTNWTILRPCLIFFFKKHWQLEPSKKDLARNHMNCSVLLPLPYPAVLNKVCPTPSFLWLNLSCQLASTPSNPLRTYKDRAHRGAYSPVNWGLKAWGLWMISFQSSSNSGILATFWSNLTRSRPIIKHSMNWKGERMKNGSRRRRKPCTAHLLEVGPNSMFCGGEKRWLKGP